MYTQNKIKKITKGCLVYLMLVCKLVYPLAVNQETSATTTTTSAGFEVKLIKEKSMNFIYAELVIFYNDKDENPAIRHLTTLNIFNEDVNKSDSSLLSTLKKLGNDFEVLDRPDYLLFKINFLRDRLPIFMQFLKGLYNYKTFSLKKFNYSIHNFWNLFFKHEDWKKKVAFQTAYQKFFPGHLLGDTLIIPSLIEKINLAQIRSFYQNNYTVDHSRFFIKGNLKPGIILGSFNRTFKPVKKHPKVNNYNSDTFRINNKREVIIYHIESSSPPEIYWFEAIPPLPHKNHIPARVLNDMLFSQPIGRLSRVQLNNGLRFQTLKTEVVNHKEVSIICNSFRLNYSDIEKFIIAVETEKKKLKKINRREYLDVKNYFCGRLKVDTRRFENQVELERDFSLFNLGNNDPGVTFSRASRQVTFESLNALSPELNGGTIVIVGNANLITRHLLDLHPRIIRYGQ